AVLVDQAFIKPRPGAENPVLATTPFWLGAAVTVSQAFRPEATSGSLALVAGSVALPGGAQRGLVALLRLSPPPTVNSGWVPPILPDPVLVSAGTRLFEETWPGGDLTAADTTVANGVAVGLVLRAHARPAFAVIRARTADKTDNILKRITYEPVTF